MGNTAQGTLMAKKGKHSRAEIAAKVAQADGLATQGKLQSEIAHTLGVSVMTFHRWRKMSLTRRAVASRIAGLELENSRLRRVVTDLLLENAKLQAAFQIGRPSTRRASR